MKSQLNSQELTDFLSTLKIHNKDLDMCFNDAMAVHALNAHYLQLALSCLPEKRGIIVFKGLGPTSSSDVAVNATIDTIEQNMRAKFQ